MPALAPELPMHLLWRTALGMTVADTLPTDADVAEGVEVAASYRVIQLPVPTIDHHQVGVEGPEPEHAESDVAGPGEVLQLHRSVVGPGTAIH